MSATQSSSSHTPGRGLRRVALFVETSSIAEFLHQCVATVLVGITLFTGMPAKAAPSDSNDRARYPVSVIQRAVTGAPANTVAPQVKSVSAQRVRSTGSSGLRAGTPAMSLAKTVPTVGFDSSAQSGSAAHSNYFGQLKALEPFNSWAQGKPEATTIADLKPLLPGLLPVPLSDTRPGRSR